MCIDLYESGVLKNRTHVQPRRHTDLELSGDLRCRQVDPPVRIGEVERADVGSQRPSTPDRRILRQRFDAMARGAKVNVEPRRRRASICPTSSRYDTEP